MRPNYLARMVLLAVLFVVTGKLGLLLAVPPGYATIIWPASGIALGMLLVHGARLWPGVLLGSFLLNAWNSGAFTDHGWLDSKLLAAFMIATGSTLHACWDPQTSKMMAVPEWLQAAMPVIAASS